MHQRLEYQVQRHQPPMVEHCYGADDNELVEHSDDLLAHDDNHAIHHGTYHEPQQQLRQVLVLRMIMLEPFSFCYSKRKNTG
jgi:hypothetical protein